MYKNISLHLVFYCHRELFSIFHCEPIIPAGFANKLDTKVKKHYGDTM